MIFAISPRGQNLRLYQKDIYDWNKERMYDRMSEVAFKYKIMPYVDQGSWGGSNGVQLKHQEKELPINDSNDKLLDELEQSMRSIYYY